MFRKLKQWWLLRKARKEEEKHIPTKAEIEGEHERFMQDVKELQREIEKGSSNQKKKQKKKKTTKKSNKKKKSKKKGSG